MSDIRILVVEDEAIVAEDIATRLQKMGYAVVGLVATGQEAIAATATACPSLILMDIMLQGDLDGVQAAEYVYSTFGTPVVYLTAYADSTTLQRTRVTHPFGYIVKPFRDRELQATIEIALARYQTEQELQNAITTAETHCQTLHQKNMAQAEYWSMASHDFRTPLSVIQTSTMLLQTYGQDWSDEKRQSYLRRIMDAVEVMSQLLDDVLTLGRVDSERFHYEPSQLNVVELCEELVESLQWSAGDRYALSFVNQGCSLTEIYLDEKLLWHLLNNLLSNAIKYSPQGGRIRLLLDCCATQVQFHVEDEGIGIPEDHLAYLFEPFHRAPNVGNIPGTGLGLAIAKRAVDLHGGQISVTSHLGQGSMFSVQLPISDCPVPKQLPEMSEMFEAPQ